MLLAYTGTPFEENRYEQTGAPEYSREAWEKEKYKVGLSFPNLPYLIDPNNTERGSLKLTQSRAILYYIARPHNLVGQSNTESAIVDMVVEQARDVQSKLTSLCYSPKYSERRGEYFENEFPSVAKDFEEFLGDNKWFAGKNLSVADFLLYEFFDQARIVESSSLDKFTKIQDFIKRFESLDAVSKYINSDSFIRRPLNNSHASFKWFFRFFIASPAIPRPSCMWAVFWVSS